MTFNDVSQDPYRGKIREEKEGVFTADKTIIKTIDSARSIYNKLRANSLKRINLYTQIEGLIQGNPPYDPSELRSSGLQHIANINDMSARSWIKRASLQYWNLLYNSEYLVRFALRGQAKNPDMLYHANKLAEHWDFVMRNRWPSFLINTAALTTQLVKFGISPAVFPDERDPRWRMVEVSKFFIPDQAQCDLDMLTTVLVETEMTVQYLWNVYEEFKDEPEGTSPWNVKELGRLLIYIANSPIKDTILPHDMMELERKLYSGDISFDRMYNDTVRIVSLLQKEFNGKISHYMFHRHITAMPTLGVGEESFLYFQQDQYSSINEAVILFTIDPGEYTIHANRGIGHEIFSLAQAKIMLSNSVIDMAKWASTLLLKSPSLATKDTENIRFFPGVPTNIGTTELVQNNLGGNISGVVGGADYLERQINTNVTHSGSDVGSPDPDSGSIAASQAKMMAFKEFGVQKNSISHFYFNFDRIVQLMTIKMLRSKKGYPGYDLAEEWKERCLSDDVPEELFKLPARYAESEALRMPPTMDVFATRVAGAGSQIAHIMGLQELQPIAPSFGAKAAKEYRRQYIMATVGPEQLPAFMQDDNDPDEISGGASLAGVENAIMQAGKSPVFSPDNEQRAHAATHLALGRQIIDQIQQQQMDPIQADAVFGVLIPHTQDHIAQLSKDPFAAVFYQKVKTAFDQLERYATLNRKNAAKMAQAHIKKQQQLAQEQQQVMNTEQLRNMQVMNDERRKNLKLTAQLDRQKEMTQTKADLAQQKVEGELALKERKLAGDHALNLKKLGNEAVAANLQNSANQAEEANPQEYLRELNGVTPSPYDIENPNPAIPTV